MSDFESRLMAVRQQQPASSFEDRLSQVRDASVPPVAEEEPKKGLLSRIADIPEIQGVVGMAKGLGNTAYHLGQAVRQITPGVEPVAEPNEITQALEAKNTPQKIGKFAEQAGEFFVPGMAGAGKLTKAAQVLEKMGLLGEMAKGGAVAAGVTEAQGGSPGEAGIVGATTPAVLRTVGAVAPRIVNSAIAAKKQAFRYGANPGQGMVDEGIISPSIINAAKQVESKLETVGSAIGKTLGLSPAANTLKTDASAIFEPIIQKAEAAVKWTDPEKLAGLQKLRQALYDAFTSINSSATAATPRELWQGKKAIDDTYRLFKGTEGAAASNKEVIKSIRTGFAKKIAEMVPEVRPLNQRYSNLAEASAAINEKLASRMGLPEFLAHSLHWGIGGAAGWLTHSPAVGIGTMIGTEALKTIPVATTTAQGARMLGSEPSRTFFSRLLPAFVSESTQADESQQE